jgi:hypothetical protein
MWCTPVCPLEAERLAGIPCGAAPLPFQLAGRQLPSGPRQLNSGSIKFPPEPHFHKRPAPSSALKQLLLYHHLCRVRPQTASCTRRVGATAILPGLRRPLLRPGQAGPPSSTGARLARHFAIGLYKNLTALKLLNVRRAGLLYCSIAQISIMSSESSQLCCRCIPREPRRQCGLQRATAARLSLPAAANLSLIKLAIRLQCAATARRPCGDRTAAATATAGS